MAWLLEAPMRDGTIPADVPITLFEIGAGDGHLARDVLDRLATSMDHPRLGALARRVTYVIGERSPALRERQTRRLARHIEAGRARVVEADGRCPVLDGPFYGVVLSNELLDVLTCDRLRLFPGGRVERVFVESEPPMTPDDLWDALAAGSSPALRETTHPLGEEPALAEALAAIRPLVDDLEALGQLPVDLNHGSGVSTFLDGVARLLTGPDRWGLSLVIDYGGTARHVLDPRHRHLRVYGTEGATPLEAPGRIDITWDVDFTELGRLAAERGLRLLHYGHQAALECAEADLGGEELRDALVSGRVADGADLDSEAEQEADRLTFEFREANGYRTAILGPPGYRVPEERFGPSDAWEVPDLFTVPPGAAEAVRAALAGMDLPDPEGWIDAGGDVVADLSARQFYSERDEVLRRLGAAGLLRRPGELGRA